MPRKHASLPTHSKIGLVAHKAVRVQAHTQVLVKTAVLLLAVAGLAAASAFITVRQSRVQLTAVLHTPPSSSVQTAGSKDVSVLGVDFRGGSSATSLRGLTLGFLADDDGEFKKKISNDVRPTDLIAVCTLQDAPNHRVSGPVSFVPGTSVLSFAMDVPLPARKTVSLRVVCDLTKQNNQSGDPDAFAFFVPGPASVSVVDASGKPIPASGVSFGVSSRINANGRNVMIVVKNASPSAPAPVPVIVSPPAAPIPEPVAVSVPTIAGPTTLTASLSSGSPSGTGIPSLGEVLRFNLSADMAGDANILGFTYRLMSTDNRTSEWNLCENLGFTSRWSMRDASDPSTRLEDAGDWSFYQADGQLCAPSKVLAFAVVDFAQAGDHTPKQIGAGQTNTFFVRLDTSAASATSDDVVRLELPTVIALHTLAFPLKAIRWASAFPANSAESETVRNLPVTGGTIVY